MRLTLLVLLSFLAKISSGQNATLYGKVSSQEGEVAFASVWLEKTDRSAVTDASGRFVLENVQPGEYLLHVFFSGYEGYEEKVELSPGDSLFIDVLLSATHLEDVVVSGTMKEMVRSDSPVPVEVYTPKFFRKNPTPSVFDALQNVNGVRPQLNCNVCNTGDIHINGLEGPYTMVLIDGMPLVGGLASVYGLSGIPNSMIERMEVVKGPSSSLYGSEAVGGLINVITKDPMTSSNVSLDLMATSWAEFNADMGLTLRVGKKASVLTGLSYYNYQVPIDNNDDGFTDVTLQDRISIFQKWRFKRKNDRLFSLAGRYLYEDRWGGQMNWHPIHRGGDLVYGESIRTSRWEFFGNYQLPTDEKLLLSVSANGHEQDSYYGDVPYFATQRIAFGQLTYDKELGAHGLLVGLATRYTYYDDNTFATHHVDTITGEETNTPEHTVLPGVFVQDQISLGKKHDLLLGMRYDHHSEHGSIWTPRLAYKWKLNKKHVLRLNAGTGFRVVSLFTEEHAALTGARVVEVREELAPERSINANLNYVWRKPLKGGHLFSLDASAWYTYFSNQILPDYDTDPNKIIYANLQGHSVTQGATLNLDLVMRWGLKVMAGATFMDVYSVSEDATGDIQRSRPVLTETWTGTWSVSYEIPKARLSIDYTGNLYSPMRLPVLGDLDPRDEMSPWWSIQNVQLTWKHKSGRLEVYGGVKNLLNFTPPANSISRSFDPFDRDVVFGTDGQVVATPQNPYALTFDPSYVYAPNQGIRGFAGIRVNMQ